MRFLLDENLPRSAARVLRDAGHEVVAVVASPLRGKKDAELLRACNEDGLIFVTFDVGVRLTGGNLTTGALLLRPPMRRWWRSRGRSGGRRRT
jgi:predicted nuclease of predicted toxin-antitoxin system